MLSSSSGSVLPKVRTYRYHEQDTPFQEWKSSAIFPTLSPDSRFQGQARSELKEISVQQEKLDIELLKRVLQLPSHLTEFSYREPGWGERGPFAFSEFLNAMRPQAHSLQHLSIHLGPCLLRQTGHHIREEDMALGSLQEFDALKTLILPFDLLIGPNPDTSTLFVDLLPNSVEEVTLKACMFETGYGAKIWTSQQVYTTLLTGLQHLMGTCTELKKLKLSCLAYRTFKEFQQKSELYKIKLRKQGRTQDVKEMKEMFGKNEASDIAIDDYKVGFDVEFDGPEVVIGSLVGYWDNTDEDNDEDDEDNPSVYSYQS